MIASISRKEAQKLYDYCTTHSHEEFLFAKGLFN